MLQTIIGLDHVVILVRDLEHAAQAWRALGFTLSPRGTHSANMGTGNYTIMFGDDYLELLGVLEPTPANAAMRDYLRGREGIERAAFTTLDAQAGADALRARGIAATGPMDFGRPVDLPGGGSTQASFRTFNWPDDAHPGGLRLFACQHLTREAVWIPQLQQHRNGVQRILRIEILAGDPRAAADQMAALTDQQAVQDPQGGWQVESGGRRAHFLFLDRATLSARYPGVDLSLLADDCAASLVLQVPDAAQAAQTLGTLAAERQAHRVVAAPSKACGLILALEQV